MKVRKLKKRIKTEQRKNGYCELHNTKECNIIFKSDKDTHELALKMLRHE